MNFNNKIRPLICCISFFLGTSNILYAMDNFNNISEENSENFVIMPKKGDYMVVYKKDLPNDVKWDEECTNCKRLFHFMFYKNSLEFIDHIKSKLSGEFSEFHDDDMCFIPYERECSPQEAYLNTKHHLCIECMKNYLKPHLLKICDDNNLKDIDQIIDYYVGNNEHLITLPQEFRSNKVFYNQLNSHCVICLNQLLLNALNVCMCSKGHLVHSDCFDEWKKKNNTCPLCKTTNNIKHIQQYIDPKILMSVALNERRKVQIKKCLIS